MKIFEYIKNQPSLVNILIYRKLHAVFIHTTNVIFEYRKFGGSEQR